jgi:hypothetical protein
MRIPSRDEPEVKVAAGHARRLGGAKRHVGAYTIRRLGGAPNLLRRHHASDRALLGVMLLLTAVLIVCWTVSMQSSG